VGVRYYIAPNIRFIFFGAASVALRVREIAKEVEHQMQISIPTPLHLQDFPLACMYGLRGKLKLDPKSP
jgi:hypothetical protein